MHENIVVITEWTLDEPFSGLTDFIKKFNASTCEQRLKLLRGNLLEFIDVTLVDYFTVWEVWDDALILLPAANSNGIILALKAPEGLRYSPKYLYSYKEFIRVYYFKDGQQLTDTEIVKARMLGLI